MHPCCRCPAHPADAVMCCTAPSDAGRAISRDQGEQIFRLPCIWRVLGPLMRLNHCASCVHIAGAVRGVSVVMSSRCGHITAPPSCELITRDHGASLCWLSCNSVVSGPLMTCCTAVVAACRVCVVCVICCLTCMVLRAKQHQVAHTQRPGWVLLTALHQGH